MDNLTYTAKILKYKDGELSVAINEEVNLFRLQTMYYEHDGDREIEFRFVDPRQFSAEQRKFIFALINDIYISTGQPIESLKEIFYWKFQALTGREISLKNESDSTMEDATLLADILLDFIFEWHIPFKKGYEILPQNREWYLYKTVETRQCCICGKPNSDIHHVDAVGAGSNRRHIDHTKRRLMCLCRKHHSELHTIGQQTFNERYKVQGITVNETTIKRLGI